jgi:hypothetical protein
MYVLPEALFAEDMPRNLKPLDKKSIPRAELTASALDKSANKAVFDWL